MPKRKLQTKKFTSEDLDNLMKAVWPINVPKDVEQETQTWTATTILPGSAEWQLRRIGDQLNYLVILGYVALAVLILLSVL